MRAINSIRNQTYSNWELIVVDDNNRETEHKAITAKIAAENEDDRIKFMLDDDNRGANVARNKGVFSASGEWTAFLDADDEWSQDYLEQLYGIIEKNDDIDLITSGYQIITKGRTINMTRDLPKGNYRRQELYGDLVSPTSAVAVRVCALKGINGFDEALPARQDYDTWLRLSEKSNFYFNNNICVKIYRDGHESISTNYMRHVNGTLMVLEKISRLGIPEGEMEEISSSHYMHIAEYCIAFDDFKLAKQYLKKSKFSMARVKYGIICAVPGLYTKAKGCARAILRAARKSG